MRLDLLNTAPNPTRARTRPRGPARPHRLVMSRPISNIYQDPLDAIWIEAARRMGVTVRRGPDSYATTDGAGTLTLTDPSGMDPDDCLAQMILHEICHWLVQGPQSIGWVDWGLDNEGTSHTQLEHACLRVQAALLAPLGLRQTLAPTTDFRAYYDALPENPFEERSEEERESITRARAALARRNRRPWRKHLDAALETTAEILHVTRAALGEASVGSATLLHTVAPRRDVHPLGFPIPAGETRSCNDCAWSYVGGRGKKLRCRQADGKGLERGSTACERFEPSFDCLGCGACCREAYDTVEVSARDPVRKLHLDLLVPRSGGYDVKRSGSRCACLRGGIELAAPSPTIDGGTASADEGTNVPPRAMPGGAPFTCSIYETRPRTCRDFTIFSEHCLSARRTVGLSR